jgi:hypothetical protein
MHRERLVSAAFLAALMIAALPAGAVTLTVTNDSTDMATSGSFWWALDQAADGDTIVFDGDYTLMPTTSTDINVPNLTIDGEANNVVFDGTSDGTLQFTLRVTAAGVTLRNIDVLNGNTAQVVVDMDADGTLLENMSISNATAGDPGSAFAGALILGDNTIVRNCLFEDNFRGLGISFVHGGSIGALGYGLDVLETHEVLNTLIEDSTFRHNRYMGLWVGLEQQPEPDTFVEVNDILVRNCRFYANTYDNLFSTGDTNNLTVQGSIFGLDEMGNMMPIPEGTDGQPLDDTNGANGMYASSANLATSRTRDAIWLIQNTSNVLIGGNDPSEWNVIVGSPRGGVLRANNWSPAFPQSITVEGNIIRDINGFGFVERQSSSDGLEPKANTWWQGDMSGLDPWSPGTYVEPAKPSNITYDNAGISGTATAGHIINVYLGKYDPLGTLIGPQFDVYLGKTTADGSGNWSMAAADLETKFPGMWITATATDPTTGDTSEDLPPGMAAQIAGTPLTDSDGDGLPDAFETEYGLDPNNPLADNGPLADPDEDGSTTMQEYMDGTNPLQAGAGMPAVHPAILIAAALLLAAWGYILARRTTVEKLR